MRLNGTTYSPQGLLDFIQSEQQKRLLPPWEQALFDLLRAWFGPDATLTLKTSGSTGPPKLIRAEKARMEASARATLDHLNIAPGGKGLLILPTTHIAGVMMVVRALVGELDLIPMAPGRRLTWQDLPDRRYDLLAATPSQLLGMVGQGGDGGLLEKIGSLLVGGAAPSPHLERLLSCGPNPIHVTYGMTETLSHVALRRLAPGPAQSSYQGLPGVQFSQGEAGQLIIQAPALLDGPLTTRDRVELISSTAFRWLSRLDHVINSGGIKIHPEVVERALAPLMATWQKNYLIAGVEDERLGESVTLYLEGEGVTPSEEAAILAACRKLCPPYEAPRQIVAVPAFVQTASGKWDRIKTLQQEKKCDHLV
ncbi:MAG: AMP-binding protein [Magnetococcales bacterium]|nr:AMP-binding protein [Magnetococcales bacterium]